MSDFIIVGNGNSVTYNDVFPRILSGEITLGVTKRIGGYMCFLRTNGEFVDISNACWFTTLPHIEPEPIPLTETYCPCKYHRYDNYDAIEALGTRKIPKDYYGTMGVPISFLDHFNTGQFEIIGNVAPILNGKHLYKRILIRRK